MGRPRADLTVFGPLGSLPVPAPMAPNPLWLPIISTPGLKTMLDLVGWAMAQGAVAPTINLFTNNYQPTAASDIGNFVGTIAGGLTPMRVPLTFSGAPGPANRASIVWPTATFVATGPGLPVNVFGYWVQCTDPATGNPGYLWAQRLVSSFGFINPGDSLPINLALSLGQC